MVVVLIPKEKGNYQGIGLFDSIWKAVKVVMDNRPKILELHDCLHGFLARIGTGTLTVEVKLVQQLVYLKQVPLYGLFLDLRKAFDDMDREHCLQILKDQGV